MADKAPEPVKSTQQLDLEARQADDYVSPIGKAKTVGPNESLVNEDGFVGVDPVYANNANETDAPLSADEGPEKVLEDRVYENAEAAAKAAEENKEAATTSEPKHAAPTSTQSGSTSSSGSSTPSA